MRESIVHSRQGNMDNRLLSNNTNSPFKKTQINNFNSNIKPTYGNEITDTQNTTQNINPMVTLNSDQMKYLNANNTPQNKVSFQDNVLNINNYNNIQPHQLNNLINIPKNDSTIQASNNNSHNNTNGSVMPRLFYNVQDQANRNLTNSVTHQPRNVIDLLQSNNLMTNNTMSPQVNVNIQRLHQQNQIRQPRQNNSNEIQNNNLSSTVTNNNTNKNSKEITQNSVNKLRNFFSQLIKLTLQKHSVTVSEQVKQSIANVINGSYTVEEFIATVAKLTNCAPAQQEMIDFIKGTLPYFRGNSDSYNLSTSIATPSSKVTNIRDNQPSTINPIKSSTINVYGNEPCIVTDHQSIIDGSGNNLAGVNMVQQQPASKIIKFSEQASINNSVAPTKANIQPITTVKIENNNIQSTISYPYNSQINDTVNNSLLNITSMNSSISNNKTLHLTVNNKSISHPLIQQQQPNSTFFPPHFNKNHLTNDNPHTPANSTNNNLVCKSMEAKDITIMDLKRKSLDSNSVQSVSRKQKKSRIEKINSNNSQQQLSTVNNRIALQREIIPPNIISINEENLKGIHHSLDQSFFDIKCISQNILPIVRKYPSLTVNMNDFSVFCSLLSHAIEHRLRNTLVDLSKQVHQRVATSTAQPSCYKRVDSKVLSQFRFLDEASLVGLKATKFIEEEKMLSLSKAKVKYDSPEQMKLKEKAKQYIKNQEQIIATNAANVVAMQAIGDRRRKRNLNLNDSSVNITTVSNKPTTNPMNAVDLATSCLLTSDASLDMDALARFKRAKPRRATQNRITVNDVQLYFLNDQYSKNSEYLYESLNFD